MGKRFTQLPGESRLAFQQRIGAIQSEERRQREALVYRSKRFRGQRKVLSEARTYPDPDGRDFDNMGESPDF